MLPSNRKTGTLSSPSHSSLTSTETAAPLRASGGHADEFSTHEFVYSTGRRSSSRAFRFAAETGVRGVVSFSDPVPRATANGHVVMPGHVGIIYQAANARYTGRGTPRTLVILPDGTSLNARSASKVRTQERGHEHVEARLRALGAPPLHGDPARWLRDALHAIGTRHVRHPGCHRYVFSLGHGLRERASVVVSVPSRPYPKGIDRGTDDQLRLF